MQGRSTSAGRDRVALIESFGGVGGARRAFELLHLEVSCHIHVESSEAARRVTENAWPGAHVISDMEEVTAEKLHTILQGYPRVDAVIQVGGPP